MKPYKPNTKQRILIRGYGMDPDDFLVLKVDYESIKLVRRGDGRTVTLRR